MIILFCAHKMMSGPPIIYLYLEHYQILINSSPTRSQSHYESWYATSPYISCNTVQTSQFKSNFNHNFQWWTLSACPANLLLVQHRSCKHFQLSFVHTIQRMTWYGFRTANILLISGLLAMTCLTLEKNQIHERNNRDNEYIDTRTTVSSSSLPTNQSHSRVLVLLAQPWSVSSATVQST